MGGSDRAAVRAWRGGRRLLDDEIADSHGISIGGAIIDGGNFDWAAHASRFPLLTEPDEAYHGAIWTEAAKPLGPIAYILRARVKLLRDLGAAIAPQNALHRHREGPAAPRR